MFNSIFLKKNHIFFYNYFLLKNYYYIFFYYFNSNFNNSLKNLDYLNHTNCNSIYFLNKNTSNIKQKLIFNFTCKNKNINIKFSNYFGNFLKKTYFFKNVKNMFFDIGYDHFYFKQFYYNKNFINFFSSYVFRKNNFLLLDSDYSHIFPLYKFIFGSASLHMHKNFFFLKPIYFTRKSWSYFFIKFCEYNNINLLFIVDYDFYIKFYKNIIEFDCSVSALIPYSYCDYFVDYPLYTTTVNTLVKLAYSSYINHLYFQSYNYSNYINKYRYINSFFKLLNFFKK